MKTDSLLHKVLSRSLWEIGKYLPVNKKKVLFSSYYGRGYSDNLKYIADEFLDDENYELIWVVKDEKEAKSLPSKIKPCLLNSIDYVYQLVTSGIWIDNCRKSFRYKKDNQVYIQTWHGNAIQKKIELDAEDKLEKIYVDTAKKDGQHTDVMISESRFMTELYHRSFWFDKTVLEIGYPRYDILLTENKKDTDKKVRNFFNLDDDKKLVLYAPTFRDDHNFDVYDIDYNNVLNCLNEKFGGEYVFLIHLHPNVADNSEIIEYDNIRIFNATVYPDMQELMAVSDILIGDYSSVNYEFSLMKKPVFRFATDVEQYKKERDLYRQIEDYPFPLSADNEQLLDSIKSFDNDKYQDDLNEFFKDIGPVLSDGSSERLADFIRELSDKNLDLNKTLIDYKEYIK